MIYRMGDGDRFFFSNFLGHLLYSFCLLVDHAFNTEWNVVVVVVSCLLSFTPYTLNCLFLYTVSGFLISPLNRPYVQSLGGAPFSGSRSSISSL